MTVVVNEAGINRFLTGLGGPVMRNMRIRGEKVERLARSNAKQIFETQHFLDFMQIVDVLGPQPYVKVGSIREKDGFSYPAYWDAHPDRLRTHRTSVRWLTDALRDGFNS